VWTGCRQRAVYTTRKHDGLADWTNMELVALLDSLFLLSAESRFLRDMFYSLYLDYTLGLSHCRVPQGPGVDYSMSWSHGVHEGHYYKVASRLSKVLLRVRPSFRYEKTCSKYSNCCIANWSSTQPTNSNRLNTQCSTLLAAALILCNKKGTCTVVYGSGLELRVFARR